MKVKYTNKTFFALGQFQKTKLVNAVKTSHYMCLNYENITTYRNYSNMILYLLTDLPIYNWCTIYYILVYNFTSFTYVYIHDCITTISTCISPPKLSSSLTPLPNHSQATMVTLYFPEIYIHQNYTPRTHFSLVSCNQHNYFDLHSYVQYIPFCCWVGSHCVGRTQLIYTLSCSSCCRYYWMWLCVDICSHSFWVKNRKELVRLYGIRF